MVRVTLRERSEMNRKTSLILLLAMVVVLSVTLLAGCSSRPSYSDDPESLLNFVGKIVRWMHGWVGNYGWTVVVFTVFLKLITLPLDFWQRITTRKTSMMMSKMQPVLDEIDARYGKDPQRANMEKQKVYKKYGFSTASSCLPMIITMVVFFVMFGGLTSYSNYNSVVNYQNLSSHYNEQYMTLVKADENYIAYYNQLIAEGKEEEAAAQSALIEFYENHKETNQTYVNTALDTIPEYYQQNHESWLWIQNIWQPDTWSPIMVDYQKFISNFSNQDVENYVSEQQYNNIREKVLSSTDRSWNGLMILPFMSVGLSFLSIFISQKLDRRKDAPKPANDTQAATNRTMMIMMPLMMAFFGFMYTGAFAIYMVFNYMLSIITTVALKVPVDKIVSKSLAKAENLSSSQKESYKR